MRTDTQLNSCIPWSQARQQIIVIHILPNISKSKGIQAMKFAQLIKYSVGNIFV